MYYLYAKFHVMHSGVKWVRTFLSGLRRLAFVDDMMIISVFWFKINQVDACLTIDLFVFNGIKAINPFNARY